MGLVGYDVVLEMAQYLSSDDDQTPWKAFVANVRYIDFMMFDSLYYAQWQVTCILYDTILYFVIIFIHCIYCTILT